MEITEEQTAIINAAIAFIDQLNSFNNFNHPEVKIKAIELAKAVGKLPCSSMK